MIPRTPEIATGRVLQAAIYCRKSSEEGLEQSFNSLHAQREACEAFVVSQRQEGWRVHAARYDDGGYSGGSMARPALQQLLQDVKNKRVDVIVVYKVDRLTRSLADFAKIIEILDGHAVSFVSVTQQFNTTSSMGRLTLNVLLSFAQFEREITGERIRDKIAASKKKGMWMGGCPPLGYDLKDRQLLPNPKEAGLVQKIFALYLELGSVAKLKVNLDLSKVRSKTWTSRRANHHGGAQFSRGALYTVLQNRIYLGEIRHGKLWYPGMHAAIVPAELWEPVQARMAAHRKRRSARIGNYASSLLTGRLESVEGQRFSPSFTVKDGKRYRYYVSRMDRKGLGLDPSPTRLPAKELEDVVLNRLQAFLASPADVLDQYQGSETIELASQVLSAAKQLASRWPQLSSTETRQAVDSCLERVVLGQDSVQVLLDKYRLLKLLVPASEPIPESESLIGKPTLIRLTIQAKLQRCRGEVCLLVPAAGDHSNLRRRPVPALIKAVARAHQWYQRLVEADSASCTSLAAQLGLKGRYVSRVLGFAFLAPDITESILNGTQPPELSFAAMARNLPLSWAEQRKRFGFAPVPEQ